MRRYVLSVICTALLCSVAMGLTQGAGTKKILRLLCGVILAKSILGPLPGVDWEKIPILPDSRETAAITASGENMARQAACDIIKQECETYILDKAAALGAELQVEIILSGETPPVPVEAVFTGPVSPGVRSQIEGILSRDLGIPKEKVTWTL